MKKIILSLFLFLSVVGGVFATNYPQASGYVNDYTSTLSEEEVGKLETKLTEYDKQTTNQIAVALIKTTEPDSIEEYAVRLFEFWKPGQKGADNGVLLLFALEDRKMRIEVGGGLEGSLTDIQAKHIIDDIMTPKFKEGKYYDGINGGIDKIIVAISPDSPLASAAAVAQASPDGSGVAAVIVILIVLFVIVVIAVAASPYTPIGGQGTWGITSAYKSSGGSFFSSGSSSGFGGFGGGRSFGGGASGGW